MSLALGMFAMGVDSYLIAGLLPDLSATLGASVAVVGQGVTVFDITYVVSAPVFAWIFARHPTRAVLVAALSVFAVGNLMTLLATDVTTYFVSRGLAGLGAGLFTPLAVASSGPTIWAANSAGVVVGVPGAMWLAERLGWQSALAVPIALGVVTLAVMGPQQAAPRERTRLVLDRRVVRTLGVTFLTATGSLGLYTYIAVIEPGPVTLRLALWAIGGLAGSFAIGALQGKKMTALLVVLVAAIALMPAGPVPYLLWGAAGWATVSAQQETLLTRWPDQGVLLVALNGSAIGLGSAVGSALGGIALANGLHLPAAAACVIACALVWNVLP